MTITIEINTLEETDYLAQVLANCILKGTVITLKGDLGAGKTTFTQFLGRHLGVRRRMTSPTFNIIKSYPLDSYMIHHMDCYRLEHSDEDLGFDEYFNGSDIAIVEWPDYIRTFLPGNCLEINITFNGGKRNFDINDQGNLPELMEALNDFSFN